MTAPRRRRRLRRRLLLFCVVLPLLAEATARIVSPDRRPEPAVPAEVHRYDPLLGWSLAPGTHGTSHRTGVPITYAINSQGLRDVETPYAKPAGTFRIVMLGDSRTFGFGVSFDQHVSTLLEGYFEGLDVVNMGVGGYGVDQALLFLRHEGLRYDPDLVLVYVPHYAAHRHMHTERWGQRKPLFLLEHGQLLLTHSPVPPVEPGEPLERLRHALYETSRLYQIVRDSALALLGRAPSGDADRQDAETAAAAADPAFVRAMHDLGQALVFAMADEARVAGAAFVLVTEVPELHAAALARGLLSLDVAEALDNPEFALPEPLEHINEAGNGVLAWELARFLDEHGLLSSSRQPAPR